MSDLRELYQELVLEHGQRPRNFREPPHWDRRADGVNPLCGDRISVYVALDGDRIANIGWQGSGCAISKASASLMTLDVRGRSRADAAERFARFRRMVTGNEAGDDLGKLAVFAGVSEFPARVKCATLAWHALDAALSGREEVVSTE